MASLYSLIDSLKDSLSIAISSLPDASSLTPPSNGISLLDTKNDLLLAYLQNLVFLIIIKLRIISNQPNDASYDRMSEDATKQLVELRIYLERGVRPLEGKLKYQLDKLLTAASEADTSKQTRNNQDFRKGLNATEADHENEVAEVAPQISELSYRPNPAAFTRHAEPSHNARTENDGIYKPPRITPTALPTTERGSERLKRPRRSGTVEDFIREELADAPMAEPSIGAGTGLRGKERERDEDRRAFEEQRLVRLPDGKKKKRRIGGGGEDLDMGLGGLNDVDFGSLKAPKKKRFGGDVEGRRTGNTWERRVKQGLRRKRH